MISSDPKGRLIIVSNRLPVCIKCTGDGLYDLSPSSGGLVTGLKGLANGGVDFLWYGWPGMEVPQKHIPRLSRALLHKHNAVPVLLDQQTAGLYYDGYSSTHAYSRFLFDLIALTSHRLHCLAAIPLSTR